MSISSIGAVTGGSSYVDGINYLSNNKSLSDKTNENGENVSGFDSVLQSFVNMLKDTDSLTKQAEEEEIKYAQGDDNTLELLVAQNKANLSLSYTVAVRDKVLDAYKEIMNMQF